MRSLALLVHLREPVAQLLLLALQLVVLLGQRAYPHAGELGPLLYVRERLLLARLDNDSSHSHVDLPAGGLDLGLRLIELRILALELVELHRGGAQLLLHHLVVPYRLLSFLLSPWLRLSGRQNT